MTQPSDPVMSPREDDMWANPSKVALVTSAQRLGLYHARHNHRGEDG
jgi:hypothetical protein